MATEGDSGDAFPESVDTFSGAGSAPRPAPEGGGQSSARSWSANQRCGGSAAAASARRSVRRLRSSPSMLSARCSASAVSVTS